MLNLYFLKFIKDVCTSDKEMFFADFEERTRGSSDYLMRGMFGDVLYPSGALAPRNARFRLSRLEPRRVESPSAPLWWQHERVNELYVFIHRNDSEVEIVIGIR